ncbi:MAG TPA: heme-binding protein, partial [Usitatibacter sp.]|nr:heme-binding protein [Usitatibacter sp.]
MKRAALLVLLLVAAACGGGGAGSSSSTPACSSNCGAAQDFLAVADVQRIIAQAVGEARARNVRAQVAVVDRVGNVLAVFRMDGAPATVAITSGLGVSAGLDGIAPGTIPAADAAIAKAITGAFLSSGGNAFSTRTASQIIQEHFDPDESQQPSGPLYGVQFSQLSCSDVNRNASQGDAGPKRAPLGLAGDPGGLPLYKNGVLVGGIG